MHTKKVTANQAWPSLGDNLNIYNFFNFHLSNSDS